MFKEIAKRVKCNYTTYITYNKDICTKSVSFYHDKDLIILRYKTEDKPFEFSYDGKPYRLYITELIKFLEEKFKGL